MLKQCNKNGWKIYMQFLNLGLNIFFQCTKISDRMLRLTIIVKYSSQIKFIYCRPPNTM